MELTHNKEAFIEKLVAFAKKRVYFLKNNGVSEEIERTMFLEKERMKNEPWRIDPASEEKFWKKIRKDLLKQPIGQSAAPQKEIDDILERIIKRYAQEIAGHFDIKTYWFARRFLTSAFTRLLNAASAKDFFKLWSMRYRLQERIQAVGEVEHIRTLVQKGTVVLVPTHYSNLDSILIGLTLDFIGLPAFSYGAGLNLFNSGFVSYFMNRLGAYRVDRRKKSAIYIETLKGYSNLSISQGVHSLFFPGGTRSRSGQIETRLKLGLLSTAVEAQRANYQSGKDEKIFIVPLTLGYHFVLEAQSLIEQYLKKTGKEHYYSKDEFRNQFKILQFLWRFFRKSSEIVLSFGKPMDVLGNFVDENGNSFDANQYEVSTKDYFRSLSDDGIINQDLQRESEYTKLLANRIIEQFYKTNTVLSSHIVAFTAYKLFEHQNNGMDVFELMRIKSKTVIFEKAVFEAKITEVQAVVLQFAEQDKLKIVKKTATDVEALIENGLSNLGIYHDRKPLYFDKKTQTYRTHSTRLLMYYHNHLKGYQIEKQVAW